MGKAVIVAPVTNLGKLPAAKAFPAPKKQNGNGAVVKIAPEMPPPSWHTEQGAQYILALKYSGQSQEPSDNIYISGLPGPSIDQSRLIEIFGKFGLQVVRSKVIPDTRGTGTCQALVQLASQQQAANAIAFLSGTAIAA